MPLGGGFASFVYILHLLDFSFPLGSTPFRRETAGSEECAPHPRLRSPFRLKTGSGVCSPGALVRKAAAGGIFLGAFLGVIIMPWAYLKETTHSGSFMVVRD